MSLPTGFIFIVGIKELLCKFPWLCTRVYLGFPPSLDWAPTCSVYLPPIDPWTASGHAAGHCIWYELPQWPQLCPPGPGRQEHLSESEPMLQGVWLRPDPLPRQLWWHLWNPGQSPVLAACMFTHNYMPLVQSHIWARDACSFGHNNFPSPSHSCFFHPPSCPETHQLSVPHALLGRKDPHPLDSPWSHCPSDLYHGQRCMELWDRDVGGAELWG